jgi:hypothetical protein
MLLMIIYDLNVKTRDRDGVWIRIMGKEIGWGPLT